MSPFPETVSYVQSVHTTVFSHRPSDTVKRELSEWPAGDGVTALGRTLPRGCDGAFGLWSGPPLSQRQLDVNRKASR
jgi:hypothetical protein